MVLVSIVLTLKKNVPQLLFLISPLDLGGLNE